MQRRGYVLLIRASRWECAPGCSALLDPGKDVRGESRPVRPANYVPPTSRDPGKDVRGERPSAACGGPRRGKPVLPERPGETALPNRRSLLDIDALGLAMNVGAKQEPDLLTRPPLMDLRFWHLALNCRRLPGVSTLQVRMTACSPG